MMSPSQRAMAYATDVIEGRIIVGRYVKLACERFMRDLARTDWPFMYDAEKADMAVRFMELMPHVKGKWAAKKLNLTFEGWQCFIECNLFGFVNRETGKRRFKESYEEVPRKNAKSTRLAARGIFLFCADGEAGAEVYSGATSEKQALEIFRPAWMMTHRKKKLRDKFNIELAGNAKNPGTMYIQEDMSKFEPLIGKPGDGASPHAALIDEYHEHDDDDMTDTMRTGMGAREQALLSHITTAGVNMGGPCYERRKEIIRILERQIEDEHTFGIIYCLDEEDAWDDEANLMKANPNFDVSVFGDFLRVQLGNARRSAVRQNAFRTKHLNEWVGAKTAWMNMLLWYRQKLDMKMEDFLGCRCWQSVDLSSKKDVTAYNITFEKDGKFYAFWKFWVPESAVEDNEKYQEFVTAGVLEVTDGSMIDHEVIEEFLVQQDKKYSPEDTAFDEWQADYMMVRAERAGVKNTLKFPFNTRNISEPMKYLDALVEEGKYFHDGNPMMTWMMGNVTARLDVRGNIFPNKDRPNDPKCKIDGAAVAIMSMGRAMTVPPEAKKYQILIV